MTLLQQALHSFRQKYAKAGAKIHTLEVHFRLNCFLVVLVRLRPRLLSGNVGFHRADALAFEADLSFMIRYAMTELCCYFKILCKLEKLDLKINKLPVQVGFKKPCILVPFNSACF